MPGSNYPDGANLYIPEAVRHALREAGLATPVVAVGKIATLALAERVLAEGKGDMVGMARALLADPDLPNKWRTGHEARVVRCVFGNVCKALDENFRRVDCTLWPKKLGHAPESDDAVPPAWAEAGAGVTAEYRDGRVLVRWRAATDNEAVYGYQVFRAEGEGVLLHAASVRGASSRFEDARVVGGVSYGYSVRPYDLAGNRGPMSATVRVDVPREHREADARVEKANDPGAAEGCAAG
jgi:hypothetical protein